MTSDSVAAGRAGWRKLGHVYAPNGDLTWARSHAYLPTPYVFGDTMRVYYACLDAELCGRVAFVDLQREDPRQVVRVAERPALDIGEAGNFDDCGVTPSCLLKVDDELWLYYFGWQRCEKVPYLLFIGLAVSRDNGETFERYSQTPILDRTPGERYIRSAPTVLVEGDLFRMWYVAAEGWDRIADKIVPLYSIHYGESRDGLFWTSSEKPVISRKGPEIGLARPWVVPQREGFTMWYSIRSRDRSYRLGCANSTDGYKWQRRDHIMTLEPSSTGWDSEMVCFGCVPREAPQYLLYNGNGYGQSGFGLAFRHETS